MLHQRSKSQNHIGNNLVWMECLCLCTPQIHILKPYPSKWWHLEVGHWEKISVRWGPEGSLWWDSCPDKKRTRELTPTLFLPGRHYHYIVVLTWQHQRKGHNDLARTDKSLSFARSQWDRMKSETHRNSRRNPHVCSVPPELWHPAGWSNVGPFLMGAASLPTP